MKKLYSKTIGGEAYALAPEQLDIFRKSGYKTPTPEEVIADAAAKVEPPEGKRVYVVFDCETGVFSVRVRTATLKAAEVGGFVGEIVGAALLCRFLVTADPDVPKSKEVAAAESPFIKIIREALEKNKPSATEEPAGTPESETPAADAPEVVE